ncbi:MAG: CPBP family intramembrane glutamic endopeptidase [Bacillota bacterium]
MENENSQRQLGIKYALLILVVGVILQFAASVIGGAIFGFVAGIKLSMSGMAAGEIQSTVQELIQNNLQYFTILAVITAGLVMIFMGLKRRKEDLKELIVKNKEKINLKLLAILSLTVVSLSLFSGQLMNLVMSLLEISTAKFANLTRMMQGGLGVFMGLVLAPIIEEIVFRGLILAGLADSYSRKKAIVVSAILFAVYHFNLFQLVPTFLVGLLLGYIYLKTRSVLICIFTHLIYNLIPVIVTQFQSVGGKVPEMDKMNYIVVIISLIALLTGIKLLSDYFQTEEELGYRRW